MQQVFLRPVTPVYFGRPGALPAGEARSGASWFPPPISAFQGMVRTRLLDDAGVFHPRDKVEELVGSPDALPPGWQLQGPFPARTRDRETMEIWLPVPAFVMKPKEWQRKKKPVLARCLGAGHDRADHFLTDDRGEPFEPLGNPGTGAEKPLPGWVSSQNLWHLLTGTPDRWHPEGYGMEFPPFVRHEDKIGLAREKEDGKGALYLSGRAREGMLYSLRTLRFAESSGLVGWFDGRLEAPLRHEALAGGGVLAGKKGGIMAFARSPGDDPDWKSIAAGDHLVGHGRPAGGNLFWIILLTPGRWRGSGAGEDSNGLATAADMLAAVAGFRDVRLVGMVCPGVTWLGGFSLARRRPRPAEAWYPAGTSLLVRVGDGQDQDIVANVRAAWNNRCVLAPGEKRPFGYGHILAAHYHEQEEKTEQWPNKQQR